MMIRCHECTWFHPVKGQTNGRCELMEDIALPNEGCTIGCVRDPDEPENPPMEISNA